MLWDGEKALGLQVIIVIIFFAFQNLKLLIISRFDGWGSHDCELTEAAGVRCVAPLPPTTPPPPTTTPKPKTPIAEDHVDMEVRITGGRTHEEGKEVITSLFI